MKTQKPKNINRKYDGYIFVSKTKKEMEDIKEFLAGVGYKTDWITYSEALQNAIRCSEGVATCWTEKDYRDNQYNREHFRFVYVNTFLYRKQKIIKILKEYER